MTDTNDIELELTDILKSALQPASPFWVQQLVYSLTWWWDHSQRPLSPKEIQVFIENKHSALLTMETCQKLSDFLTKKSTVVTARDRLEDIRKGQNALRDLIDTEVESVLTIRLMDGRIERYQGRGFRICTKDGVWLHIAAHSGLRTDSLSYNIQHVLSWDVRAATPLESPK